MHLKAAELSYRKIELLPVVLSNSLKVSLAAFLCGDGYTAEFAA
jgi:hypothetical protein